MTHPHPSIRERCSPLGGVRRFAAHPPFFFSSLSLKKNPSLVRKEPLPPCGKEGSWKNRLLKPPAHGSPLHTFFPLPKRRGYPLAPIKAGAACGPSPWRRPFQISPTGFPPSPPFFAERFSSGYPPTPGAPSAAGNPVFFFL